MSRRLERTQAPFQLSTESSWTPAPWTSCLIAVYEANILFIEHVDVAVLASPPSLAGSMLVAVDRARRLECRVNTLPLTACELFCSAGEQLFTNAASNGCGGDQKIDTEKRASAVLVVETPFLGLALEFLTERDKNQFLTEFLQMKQVAVLQAHILQSAVRFLETTWLHHRWRALYASLWAQFGAAHSSRIPSEISARALTLEAAIERIEALYRAVLAQHLRKRLAKACQVARQRGMNVRIEGRCCVGASLVTKAWISAGWAQIQWLRAAVTPASDEKGPPMEPIPGATNRIYVCSGEDLSKTLVVRWTVRSLRTGAVIDEFQLQTKPVFIERQSLEAAMLQRWGRRPCCRVLCVRMQHSESDMNDASMLKESESYLLSLQSDEVAFYPSEVGDQRLPSAERSSRRPSLSSSAGLSAAASLLSIPYRVLYVSSDVCAPSSKPLLLIADTARGISLVLAARSFAERNVAICVLQHLSHAAERPETGPAPPPGIARFAVQAAAAAERVTASRLDSAQPTNIVQRAETVSSEADRLSVLDLDVSVASRDSFSSSHDGEVRRDGRSVELARAGWHALGRGIAGLVQSSKSFASRPSFERWRGLSRGGRSSESSQRVRSAIEYLYLQYVREG
ncbi:hypothetical protein F1559_002820 [Cyanidiococcus yangmingshanensis]|uniref:Uncharacterized protein n=1 Tax=Cyanidiococcus yangmingshanensis TaxID=2690220 RepID=A0A7J7IKC5_9RHOD|nr:hypothetical protein F1559_002820 [Cyanidiococcus yangmingshanensis]